LDYTVGRAAADTARRRYMRITLQAKFDEARLRRKLREAAEKSMAKHMAETVARARRIRCPVHRKGPTVTAQGTAYKLGFCCAELKKRVSDSLRK
jgi:hypothetical protein